MHELALAESIVAIALEHSQGARIHRLTLEIGQLAAVLPDSLRFGLEVCCQGTVLEGAELDLVEIPGRGRCRQCGAEMPLEQPFGICDCGSCNLEIIHGNELTIKTLELELCA